MPLAKSCPFFAITMVFDLVCFTSLLANNKSFISLAVGALVVASFKSASNSVFRSLSCSITPFNKVLKEKRILVVPTQVPRLAPEEIIPVTLSLDNFSKDDDRANIRWKVTAIRVEK